MFEETIDASPNRLNRSLREKREHRKTRSRRLSKLTSETLITPSVHEEMVASQLFSTFWDSENEENEQELTNSAQNKIWETLNNFERFKAENMLAEADRSSCRAMGKPQRPTQMFQTCEKLMETQQDPNTTEYLSCEMDAEHCFKVQTEWMLEPFEGKEDTDQDHDETLKQTSPMRTTCIENNNIDHFNVDLDKTFLNNDVLAPVMQTKNTKSIVNQILEDFCASLSSSDDESKSVDFEPYFRFRKKKIRTYERRFRRSNLINDAVASPFNAEDIDISDTSSELSVQENKTQLIPAAEPLVLNISGAVQNNLLNLSAFFTQNLLENKCNLLDEDATSNVATNVDNKCDIDVGMIDENEIMRNQMEIGLSRNEPHVLSAQIEREPFAEEFASNNDEEEFRAAPLIVDNKFGLAADTIDECRNTQTHREAGLFEDVPQVVNDRIEPETLDEKFAAEEELNLSQRKATNTDISNATIAPDSSSMDNIIAPVRSYNSEPYIFSDETWQDDSEFFLNFKTQTILKTQKSHTNIRNSPRTSMRSSSTTNLTTSKSLKTLNQSQENIDEQNHQTDMPDSQIDVNDVLKLFEQPTTETNTNHHLHQSDEKDLKCNFDDMMLSEWQLEKTDETDDVNMVERKQQSVAITNLLEDKQIKTADAFAAQNDELLELFEKNEFWTESFTQLKKQENQHNTHCEPSTSKQAAALLINQQCHRILESHQTLQSSINIKSDASPKSNVIATSNQKLSLDIKMRPENLNFENKSKVNEIKEHPNIISDNLAKSMQQNCSNQQHLETSKCKDNAEIVKCKFMGFETASCKPITISEKARKKYQHFFDEINKEDDCYAVQQPVEKRENTNREVQQTNVQINENYPCDNLPTEKQEAFNANTTATAKCKLGFQTASCKPINISEKAIKQYEHFFDEIIKEDESNVMQQPIEKNETKEHEMQRTSLELNHVPKQQQQTSKLKEASITNCKFMGFQTASSKPINISEKAKKKYQNFFDEILKEEDFNAVQQPNVEKETKKQEIQETHLETNRVRKQVQQTLNQNAAAPSKSNFIGFQTASSKPISISDKAKEKYQNFFDEILREEDCNAVQQLKVTEGTKKQEIQETNLETSLVPKQLQQTFNHKAAAPSKSNFIGFQTASSKPISISDKAKEKYQNFFDEILKEDECNASTTTSKCNDTPKENGCNAIQQSIKKRESNKHYQAAIHEDSFANIQLSEWLPGEGSPKLQQQQTPKVKLAISPKPVWSAKRKFRSLENTDTTASEQPNKMLCKSNTMDDISALMSKKGDLRSSVSEMSTTSSKTADQTPSVIVRKNLLSLTKKRKQKLKQSLEHTKHNDEINNVETPVKLATATKLSTELGTTAEFTPSATDFYARLPDAASTPQAQLETPSRRSYVLGSADNLDSDFKRINWEQLDDGKSTLNSSTSVTTPTRIENTSLNSTIKPLPSPQERIENLSACGDPPPLPQIVTSNISRCRSLGLSRRCRKSFPNNSKLS